MSFVPEEEWAWSSEEAGASRRPEEEEVGWPGPERGPERGRGGEPARRWDCAIQGEGSGPQQVAEAEEEA